MLEVGAQPTTAEDRLTNVRAAVLRGGELIVADGGDQTIRAYDAASGRLIVRTAGWGVAAGFFEMLAWADVCRNGVVYGFDPISDRVTKFDRALRAIDVIELPDRGDQRIEGVVCGRGDRLLILYSSRGEGVSVGPYRPWMELVELSPINGSGRRLGWFPGTERYRFVGLDGPRPLGKVTKVVGLDDSMVIVTNDGWRVAVYDYEGRFLRHIEVPNDGLRQVTEADIDRRVALQDDPNTRLEDRDPRSMLVSRDYPTHFPPYKHALESGAGHLWLQLYPRPGELREQWLVLNTSGGIVARLTTPERFRVLSVPDTAVVGVTEVVDSTMREQRVQIRKIIPGGAR